MKFEITKPTSLRDIKLSQYKKFVKTTKGSEDEFFIGKQMISIFCNIPDSLVSKIRAKDFDQLVNDITEVLNQKPVFIPKFKMNGVEYGFIPNLEEITVGEKADLDTFYKDLETMDKAMGILYRPIALKRSNGYLIEDYGATGEPLDVTLDVAFGANVFFLNLIEDLSNYIQNYISKEAEVNPKVSRVLEENGVGTQVFINSLKEVFSNFQMSLN